MDVKFSYSNYQYSGIAQNISEKGVCFAASEMILPCGSLVELLVPLKDKCFSVLVKVNRLMLETTPAVHFFFGGDVLNPPKEYLDFVNSLGHA